MSNKTQAQLLKSASNAINGKTSIEANYALITKTFNQLVQDDILRLLAPNASVAEIAAKLYMEKKQTFLDNNIAIGQLAIAMNNFRKSIESQYKLDFSILKEEIYTEIGKTSFSKEEMLQSVKAAQDEMKENVAPVILNFLNEQTNKIIDQYYIDHPEKTMNKAKETNTNEIKPEDLPTDAAGNVAAATQDTGTVSIISPMPEPLKNAVVGEQVVVGDKTVEVIEENVPDLSTPRARFLHRMGKAMDEVAVKETKWHTGSHCHDLDPTADVNAAVEYLEEIKDDKELTGTSRDMLVKFGEKLVTHQTKKLVKEDEARAKYDPNSMKFKIMNMFAFTAY